MENLINQIKSIKVDEELDLNTDDLLTILNNCSGSIVTAMHFSFKAGYIQGSKSKKDSLQNSPNSNN